MRDPQSASDDASKRLDPRRARRIAEPAQRPVLFVNPRSGDGAAARAGVAQRARELGIEVVTLEAGRELGELVRVAVENGADALGMAGGDGSLSVVAAVAAANGLPFVCIPAGTRNHFAGDLGLDRRHPVAALRAFGDGFERRIDLGEVNGRLFLNNVSLGVYGEAVRTSTYREAKVRTLVATAEQVLGPSAQMPGLRLVDDEGREHDHPLIVIVSNNPYAVDRPPARGARPALDGGRLGVVVLDAPSRGPHAPGRAWTAEALEVSAPTAVHAGIDGEAVELDPPLRFAIRPGALRVRVPSGLGIGSLPTAG
jgi:diacylglycerol kinase family enzyme